MNKIMSGICLGCVVSMGYVMDNHETRIRALENKGSVTVELGGDEPTTNTSDTNIKSEFYNIPHLYNIKRKILFTPEDVYCLAKNIYYESRGEGYIGKISVAQITFNRAQEKDMYICDVIQQPKQFSWTNKTQEPPKGNEWKASIDAALAFQYGVRVHKLNNVTHYHTPKVNPVWDNNMTKVATIGNHDFYSK